jgi:hypothetical protein
MDDRDARIDSAQENDQTKITMFHSVVDDATLQLERDNFDEENYNGEYKQADLVQR